MSHLWQHPFVNVFKHFDIQSWKKASKEGEVSTAMDKVLKGTVYKITGAIPAGNYIQLPKTSSQSLGLTGRYMYLCFKAIPSKYFVVHIDVATQDGLVVRISFSNLFKEFKSTSTWLQFPFVCNASKGSVCSHAAATSKEPTGPAPMSTRWTVLNLDFQYILSMYLNRRYSYMKNIRLCANMLVKNIFTSDMEYEPGVTFDQVKKTGLTLSGLAPMPRDMSFPLGKTLKWHDQYDLIRFPSETNKKPFDSIQYTKKDSEPALVKTGINGIRQPRRVEARVVTANRSTMEKQSLIDHVTDPRIPYKRKPVTSELPSVGLDDYGDISIEATPEREVHVYAHPTDPVIVERMKKRPEKIQTDVMKIPKIIPEKKDSFKGLSPDPILHLRRIVGFGGCTTRHALWSNNGSEVVYPCHAVVVSMQVSNGYQRFFIGHTDKISAISMNGASSLLASGQTGTQSVVRVWRYQTGECLAMVKAHVHTLSSLSMSNSGSVLAGVGKDSHNKNMVVIWNTGNVSKGGQVSILAKAHTDVDIVCMKIAGFDDTRMVSCGRDNIRLWRVKDGSLRSAPVNLGEHHLMEFTDCCFEAGYEATKDPLDRLVYACSRSGHIFEVDYRKVAINHVRRLHPMKADSREKQTFNSGPGIAINCMTVNEAFCVTGSDDGYLRLWPLDFKHVYLEAEHEAPVTAVDISADGVKILAGTCSGNLGVLDISTRGYTTVMRSHTASILGMSLDPIRRRMATVSEDHSIRIWDVDTMQQLCDFSAPKECPSAIAYHPSQEVFTCGFESGAVRVFSVATTSMLAEHRQHRGKVTGVAYAPSGDYVYSCGSLGALALYDASDNQYQLLRLLGNTVARGQTSATETLAVSPDGKRLAFVGPTEFTVSVVDGRSLDEILRIDVTSLAGNPSAIDTAICVKYAPANVKHLLVTTSSKRLLKFDARNGKLLAEIDNIHRQDCSALDVSSDGRFLATAGDRVLKIWDYHMRLDLNFQVFIGHSEVIRKAIFTPDSLGFISVGEAIFFWDFLARNKDVLEPEGRTTVKNYFTGREEEYLPFKSPARYPGPSDKQSDVPRLSVPQPAMLYPPGDQVANISVISKTYDDLMGEDIVSVISGQENFGSDLQFCEQLENAMPAHNLSQLMSAGVDLSGPSPRVQRHQRPISNTTTPAKKPASKPSTPGKPQPAHQKPAVYKQFTAREKQHPLAQRRYTAPPNQAGLKLKSVMGYNGNGRNNMVWHADTGVFAYTSGCTVVVEDLNEGTQKHLTGHTEEISTLALQHDCQVLASASGSYSGTPSQIHIWDLEQMVCKKTMSHHEHEVVAMSFSRDDRFLLSLGDHRDCCVVVWSALKYCVLCTTQTAVPMFDIMWDPYTMNEFSSVGEKGALLFWLLDETGDNYSLNVHEAYPPEDLMQNHHMAAGQVDFTCLEYTGDSTLYVATNNGKVSAWDTRHNTCFMHWEADSHEIGVLISRRGRLITGSTDRRLKLWSVVGVGDLRLPMNSSLQAEDAGLTMEDEMTLDGAIVSASFDDTMDLGIVGTSSGTLWYINWPERASIRLVSGHGSKVNAVQIYDDQYIATCSDDGSLRIWSLSDREQTLQFQVLDQSCNCLAFSPVKPNTNKTSATVVSTLQSGAVVTHSQVPSKVTLPQVVAGYSDGTVRMFDLSKVEMVLKMHPHPVVVSAISFSADGRMILSGGSDGLVAISSPTTGMTVRVISDHKGAPITCIDVAFVTEQDVEVSAPMLWLAASVDRRVSVWSSDWSKDYCELIDWLTFPAPAFTPDGTIIKKGDQSYFQHVPPSLARFSREEQDVVVYTGYGMQKQLQYYSLSQRKVLRTVALTHWATCLDISSSSALIAVGNNERLLQLIDYFEGSFQDYVGHDNSLHLVKFSQTGRYILSVAHNEMLLWEVAV